MRYKYKKGVNKANSRRRLGVFLPVAGLFTGAYLLVNSFAPAVPPELSGQVAKVTETVTAKEPAYDSNRLYIPKLGVDVVIEAGLTNETLKGEAWHRKPENGSPVDGGNFVLAAHRFNLGVTPLQTNSLSPFYHIESLESGDEIFADYDGQRFAYKVARKYSVPSNAVEIENRSEAHKLTLYSCDLQGPEAGRDVIEAELVGKVAWDSGKPRIQSSL